MVIRVFLLEIIKNVCDMMRIKKKINLPPPKKLTGKKNYFPFARHIIVIAILRGTHAIRVYATKRSVPPLMGCEADGVGSR
jgi:hypothetical protein